MNSLIYKKRSNGGEHGTVYTNKDTVYFMLDQINYKAEYNLSSISILDPCSGDGVFLISCLERLLESSKKYNFSFENTFLKNFLAVEIDDCKLQKLIKNIKNFLQKNKITIFDFNEVLGLEDFLMKSIQKKFDIVIGNPPYIRYDNIPDIKKKIYKKEFSTFKGRCDIYVPFYEKGLNLLKKDGKLCYICSNRWLKNNYGTALRKLISNQYDFDKIINLENIKIFDENVIAYPSITIIKNSISNNQTEYYEVLAKEALDISLLLPNTNDERYKYRLLNDLVDKEWDFGQVKHPNFRKIIDQGFEIGIGLATGADRIFISKTLNKQVENDILLPLILSKDLRGNHLSWGGNYLINPFNKDGELVDLDSYPKLEKYFDSHKEALLMRHVGKKNPNKWYRTIDKVKYGLLEKKKLIIPDTSANEIILMDQGNYYPHHNLSYITHVDEKKLKILGAILSSDFGKNQMKKIGNTMNGGFIRWQIQNLKKINLPNIEEFSEDYRNKIVSAYETGNINDINIVVKTILEKSGILG